MTLLAVAHRAGNDLAALRTALELGVDVLEADVRIRGARLEVRHSKQLRPLLWDRGPRGLEVSSTRVPQLELSTVLAALDGGTTVMLDLKGAGRVGPRVAQLVHAARPTPPLLVCSRWWPGVEAFRALPQVRPVLTARSRVELLRLRRRVAGPRRPYGVSLHGSLLSPAVVAALRARVDVVMTWGVNDLAALDRVVDMGVNGVISDDAQVLQAVLARR